MWYPEVVGVPGVFLADVENRFSYDNIEQVTNNIKDSYRAHTKEQSQALCDYQNTLPAVMRNGKKKRGVKFCPVEYK